MSDQIARSHLWSDKPVVVKQGVFFVVFFVITLILVVRLRARTAADLEVKAFSAPHSSHSNDDTSKEMAKHGVKSAAEMKRDRAHGGEEASRLPNRPRIHERTLFDGLVATVEVIQSGRVSTEAGASAVDVVVSRVIPDEVISESDGEEIKNAHLTGQFQPNFETKRLLIRFTDLVTKEGRRYAIAGAAIDAGDHAPGASADYSSGLGYRILGATLGEAITVGDIYATSRVLQNPAGQNAAVMIEMNRALTDTTGQATASLSDEATRDLRGKRPVLSLDAGRHFWVKLQALPQTDGRGP